jgi:hypothetical protein
MALIIMVAICLAMLVLPLKTIFTYWLTLILYMHFDENVDLLGMK